MALPRNETFRLLHFGIPEAAPGDGALGIVDDRLGYGREYTEVAHMVRDPFKPYYEKSTAYQMAPLHRSSTGLITAIMSWLCTDYLHLFSASDGSLFGGGDYMY